MIPSNSMVPKERRIAEQFKEINKKIKEQRRAQGQNPNDPLNYCSTCRGIIDIFDNEADYYVYMGSYFCRPCFKFKMKDMEQSASVQINPNSSRGELARNLARGHRDDDDELEYFQCQRRPYGVAQARPDRDRVAEMIEDDLESEVEHYQRELNQIMENQSRSGANWTMIGWNGVGNRQNQAMSNPRSEGLQRVPNNQRGDEQIVHGERGNQITANNNFPRMLGEPDQTGSSRRISNVSLTSLIPCDICGSSFPFGRFEVHYKKCENNFQKRQKSREFQRMQKEQEIFEKERERRYREAPTDPLSPEEIGLLVVRAFQPVMIQANEATHCSYCLEDFEEETPVVFLPCMHFYHEVCIKAWMTKKCTCPKCNLNVREGLRDALTLN